MKQKFFHIPVADSAAAEAELNDFCDQQSVSHLEKHLVMDGQHSFWAVCVTWSGNTNSPVSSLIPKSSELSAIIKPVKTRGKPDVTDRNFPRL